MQSMMKGETRMVIEERKAIWKGGLPGERIQFRNITNRESNKARKGENIRDNRGELGKATEVEEKSTETGWRSNTSEK